VDSLLHLCGVVFDVVLAPLGHDRPEFDMLAWPVIAGVVALLVYKRVSNQKGIARAKNRIQVHLLEVVLYRDDLFAVLVATAKALGQNFLYLAYNIVPMLVMFAPITLVLVQLVAHYAYRPLEPGEPVLVQVELADSARSRAREIQLELPDGVTLDAPPVRTTDGRAAYRVVATEGDHVLRFTLGGEVQDKALAVGGENRKVPVLRGHGLDAVLYPGERALPSDSAFQTIKVSWEERGLGPFPSGEAGILVWFFVFSLAAGFLLKDRFGVTL